MSFELKDPESYALVAWKYAQRALEEEDPDNATVSLTFALLALVSTITNNK